jgi:hypothetical protein
MKYHDELIQIATIMRSLNSLLNGKYTSRNRDRIRLLNKKMVTRTTELIDAWHKARWDYEWER